MEWRRWSDAKGSISAAAVVDKGRRLQRLVLAGLLVASTVLACGGPADSGDPPSATEAPSAAAASPTPPAGAAHGDPEESAPHGAAASSSVPTTVVRRALVQPQGVPASMKACRGCHQEVVDTYLADHAMAVSLGPMRDDLKPPPGSVERVAGGGRYELTDDGMILAHGADGGLRRQRLVGWIGGGVFDVSWVGEEVDVLHGQPSGRLFFAPVETLREHGNQLSPFDLTEQGAGFDLALNQGCLTCHTLTPLVDLPEASLAVGSNSLDHVFPDNGLGSAALDVLDPLGCDACHGDGAEHLRQVTSGDPLLDDELGIASLGQLPVAEQRDVCARCHLQGDARLDLVAASPDPLEPLAAQIPVLLPAEQGDDFRFVGQVERLMQSPCYLQSEAMTCNTCHDPHRGVAAQGLAKFEAICQSCHGGDDQACSRSAELTVEEASGRGARTLDQPGQGTVAAQGCVDCHMRRSQPFDLPHVASVDHWIRRRIPPPQDDVPHRQFADREGPVEVYDDGRLKDLLATAAGSRWQAGVEAISLLTMGRIEDAAERFDRFPPAGSSAARQGTAPKPLVSLETQVMFHHSRGLTLMASGRFDQALAALDDALALDPRQAAVLLTRAQLRFDLGDVGQALQDTQTVIDLYPDAEQPWDLRARMAERLGRVDLAQAAFEASEKRWPSNAEQLFKLGLLQRQVGREDEAQEALQKAYLLDPDLELGGAGPLVDHLGGR